MRAGGRAPNAAEAHKSSAHAWRRGADRHDEGAPSAVQRADGCGRDRRHSTKSSGLGGEGASGHGRGERRPSRTAARVCRRGRAAGRRSGRGRGTATEISAPRGGRRCGGRGTAAGSAPRADGRGGVSPQTNGAEGRGSGGPPPRRSAPRVNGRGGTSLRRPRNGRGDRRPARMAARICRRGQAAGRGSGRGRGTATEISVPRGRQRGCVATDERRRGEGERRPAAADAPHGTAVRGRRCGGRGDQRPERTALEVCRHGRAARRGGGVEPRRRTEHRLGSGDAAGQKQWPRQASPLERWDALGQALHASESFLGDRREAFGDAKARKEPRRRTKHQLGVADAAGRAAATDAPDAPRQQPSMHTHSNWQGGRRGGSAPTGGAKAGPTSSE